MPKSYTSLLLPSADGIRGLACIIVLALHASVFWTDSSAQLRGAAKYGVWLFFVLSAFLLTLRMSRRELSLNYLIEYLLGRSLRILPLYIIACLLYYVANVGIRTQQELFAALSFQEGFIHLWTVPVEFGFYLILPAWVWCALKMQKYYGDATLLIATLLVIVCLQWLWPYWRTPLDSPQTYWYLPCFLFGSLAALLLPRFGQLPRHRLATPVALATFVTLTLFIPGVRQSLFGVPMSDDLVNKHLFIGLLWALFIGLTIEGHGLIGHLLNNRLLRLMGRFSYSIYLFHWLPLVLFSSLWPGEIWSLVGALIVILSVGALSYYFLERPLDKLRKRLASGKVG